LTAYRNLPTVPSPTLYDVPFSHNTNVTDRRQTDGQNIVPLARPYYSVQSAKNAA